MTKVKPIIHKVKVHAENTKHVLVLAFHEENREIVLHNKNDTQSYFNTYSSMLECIHPSNNLLFKFIYFKKCLYHAINVKMLHGDKQLRFIIALSQIGAEILFDSL